MQLIIAGFEIFADFDYNPSQLAVSLLPDSLAVANSDQQIPIKRLVLKCCCAESWQVLDNELKQAEAPCIVILTGLAGTRSRISLERFALNIRDYRIPDNAGYQPEDERIDHDGPDAVRTPLPLPALCKQLTESGFLCDVSNHAGSFLCNEVYYRSLRAWQTENHPALSLFVHLPLAESYSTKQQEENEESQAFAGINEEERPAIIQSFSHALLAIARFACTWLQS